MKKITALVLVCSVPFCAQAQSEKNDTIDNTYQLQDVVVTENKKSTKLPVHRHYM
ncbi:hypothetical protein [Xylanibacter rarus]|uniref:hypothetical protein n=1 Tax=Xylanibacter rarus TaxID=1676614 RepID=UPI000AA41DF8|nr:hypothetical protein [Xylanibacter rarus]